MKIVLIQPKIGYMDVLRSKPSPPLGLLSAASRLVEHYDVELIDARVVTDLTNRLASALTPDTVYVGITCHTGPMIQGALRASELVKRMSEVPVVWGGIHASLDPDSTVSHPNVDMCVVGEGEQTALELARALEAGEDAASVPGVVLCHDGRLRHAPARELLPAGDWPEPAWSLIDLADYLPTYQDRPSLFYQASRGCPHRCGYCYNVPFNRRRYRKLAPARVIKQIARLRERFAFRDVYFVDDNFFVDMDWAEKIADGLARMGLTWQVQGVDIGTLLRMEPARIQRLSKSGCRRMTIGVETGSNRMREKIHKFGTRDDVVQGIGKLQDAGLLVFVSFLVGMPSETLDDMRATVELALDLVERHDYVRCSPFYCYTPFPGTECFQQSLDEGFVPPKSLEEWARVGAWDNFTWERRDGQRVLGRNFFEGLNMATLFLDRKSREYSSSRLLGLLADLYRPLARWRARRMFFRLMPERWLLHRFYDHLTDAS